MLFNHAGTIVIKPFLETSFSRVGVAARRQRALDVPDDARGAARHDRRWRRLDRLHLVDLGVAATPMEVLYDTTKGACHMFARAIAVEFRDRNIRCNAVCPGFIRTPHGMREVADLQKLGVDVSEAAIAAQQGRIGEPEEVAKAALFLASDEASFVNGAHLFVDNGVHGDLSEPRVTQAALRRLERRHYLAGS